MKEKRLEGPTPSGGAYAELVFLDKMHRKVDESEAYCWYLRECDESGKLISESTGLVKR